MKINLGVNTCFALKIWPNADEWADLIKNELKLDLIEFDSDFLDPLYNNKTYKLIANEIKEIIKKNNLDIHSYFTGEMTHCTNFLTHPDPRLREDNYNWCLGAIDIASIIGAKGIGGNFNNISYSIRKDKKKYEITIKNLLNDLIKLSYYSKEKGLEFIFWEQMYAPSEVPYTIKQSENFIKYLDKKSFVPIKLVIDLGHMCCQNFSHNKDDTNPYTWLKKLGKNANTIHLQQTDALYSRHWPFTEEYNKNGIINAKEVLSSLYDSGTKEGNLILEIFFPLNEKENKVLKDMKESVDYWKTSIHEFQKTKL